MSAAMPSPAAASLLRAHRFRWIELLPWVAAIAVYFLFPGYRLMATQILVLILFALSLDLIVGYAGIVSLGHAAFFGTGAYAAALLANAGWQEPLTAVAAGAVAAGILGYVSGWVVLRTKELTLLMLTMALGIMLYELAKDLDQINGIQATIFFAAFTLACVIVVSALHWHSKARVLLICGTGLALVMLFGIFFWRMAESQFTGGFDGINFENSAVLGLFPFDPLYFSTNYWYAFAFLVVGFIVVRMIVHAPFGRSLVGIRENERRMHAIGTPVQQRMRHVYTIAAVIAGVAGAIWVQVQGNITIAVYEFEMSGNILIMVILGGAGRLYGAFIGVIVFTILENLTETVLGTDPPFWELVVGVALVLTVLFAPKGLLGLFDPIARRFKGA